MKGRLFSATMLVIVLVLVLVVPASAGKPTVPRVSVQTWTKPVWYAAGEDSGYIFNAQGISWQNAPASAYLVAVVYVCPVGTRPGASCPLQYAGWELASINISGQKTGSGEQFGFMYDSRYPCGVNNFPAILMVDSPYLDLSYTVLASALAPYKFTCKTPPG
jgi:hypothetical protein